MTNEQRASAVLAKVAEQVPDHVTDEMAAALRKAGLLVPDPPQRYKNDDTWLLRDNSPIGRCYNQMTLVERNAVLAALNELPEEP